MKIKMYARVEEGKIVQGPAVLPPNFFAKIDLNNEVSQMAVASTGWLPIVDNSIDVDSTKFAVSADFKMEILADRVIKTHKIKEFPPEFIEAYNRRSTSLKATSQ